MKSSFQQYEIKNENNDLTPPFWLKFPAHLNDKSLVPTEMKKHKDESVGNVKKPNIEVEADQPAIKIAHIFIDPQRHNMLLSLPNTPIVYPGNQIPFTPTQVEAIRSGIQDGLILVIGSPRNMKTDIAVQIINNLYRNYPNQWTLLYQL